jgi:K+-transporting ATPase ATPase C chain
VKKILVTACIVFCSLTLLVGIVYPVLVWGIGNLFFRDKAQGSLVIHDGQIIGSLLIAQSFTEPQYLHPRPSTGDYNGTASGGSNYAPSNLVLVDAVRRRVDELKKESSSAVPLDMVMSSASGLDPEISIAAALWQVPRIAQARGIDEQTLVDIIYQHAQMPVLGFIGEARVNVLLVNTYLDDHFEEGTQ